MERTIAYLLATLLCLPSCTATLPAPPSQQKEIRKESPPLPATHTYLDEFFFDPYPFVGSINYSSSGRLIGSGIVIAPNLILTVAHVSEGRDDDLMFVEYDGDTHCVAEVIYYPTHYEGLLQHDIAILVLETESDENPVSLINPENDLIYKKMKLTTIGYGTGRKRYSNFGVFWYYGRLIGKPEFMIMLPLEASIWFGDSGGAVVTLNNKLMGVMSYMESTWSGVIYENGCVSMEYYRDWIEEIKNEQSMERSLEGMDKQ